MRGEERFVWPCIALFGGLIGLGAVLPMALLLIPWPGHGSRPFALSFMILVVLTAAVLLLVWFARKRRTFGRELSSGDPLARAMREVCVALGSPPYKIRVVRTSKVFMEPVGGHVIRVSEGAIERVPESEMRALFAHHVATAKLQMSPTAQFGLTAGSTILALLLIDIVSIWSGVGSNSIGKYAAMTASGMGIAFVMTLIPGFRANAKSDVLAAKAVRDSRLLAWALARWHVLMTEPGKEFDETTCLAELPKGLRRRVERLGLQIEALPDGEAV